MACVYHRPLGAAVYDGLGATLCLLGCASPAGCAAFLAPLERVLSLPSRHRVYFVPRGDSELFLVSYAGRSSVGSRWSSIGPLPSGGVRSHMAECVSGHCGHVGGLPFGGGSHEFCLSRLLCLAPFCGCRSGGSLPGLVPSRSAHSGLG
jgi:hypothetical protein